jgi:ABC-type multidrug transport system ATPase subunit
MGRCRRALMWEDVLRMRRDEGVTVFLTTHYMDEAEYADRIAIIDHGRIIALDTPANARRIRSLPLLGHDAETPTPKAGPRRTGTAPERI